MNSFWRFIEKLCSGRRYEGFGIEASSLIFVIVSDSFISEKFDKDILFRNLKEDMNVGFLINFDC